MKYPEEMYLDSGFYDGDMDVIIENHKEKIVKCRKDHKCSACQNIIKKGDKALYESGFMDKKILEDYIDACEFIKETEAEIKKLKKKRRIVIDKVRGSNPEFPYQLQSFGIAGTTNTYANEDLIKSNEHMLEVQKQDAQELKVQVEKWMKEIPFRMRRIIKHKVFEKKSWGEVAALMGKKCTADSVRMEYQRFMGEK